MRRRVFFVAGLAVGYLLGTKAGRERYEQIVALTDRLWGSSLVQRNVGRAEGYVKAKAPKVVELVEDGARAVVHAASAPKRRPAARSTSKSAAAKAKPTEGDD